VTRKFITIDKYINLKHLFALVLLLVAMNAWTQQSPYDQSFRQGQGYLHWGWNRAAYTRSDIHFKGDDYDFTLYKVRAHDRPTTPITPKRYLVHLFTPQTNYKAGYFIRDNLAISFGVDHMKYVMDQDQLVTMKGNITRDVRYKGEHNGPMQLTRDFLTFEHTNGLNYINVEVEKYSTLYDSRKGKVHLRWEYGGGAGILFPKSDIKLMDYNEDNRFHVSGFGASLKAGIAAVFFHHLFWRLETKGGYIGMPDIVLHEEATPGKVKQHFFFWETDTNLGITANLSGRRHKKN
jgi:hypothetical protein